MIVMMTRVKGHRFPYTAPYSRIHVILHVSTTVALLAYNQNSRLHQKVTVARFVISNHY